MSQIMAYKNGILMKSHNSNFDHHTNNLPNNVTTAGNNTQLINYQPPQHMFKLKIDKSVFVHEQKGKIKARYKVLETLGKGSYGEVKKI